MDTESRKLKYRVVQRFRQQMLYGLALGSIGLGVVLAIIGIVFGELGIVALGLGFVSVGLALVARDNEVKSDRRMTAMVRLQVDDRLARMDDPMQDLMGPRTSTVLYNIRAALQLEPWLDGGQRRELKKEIAKTLLRAKKYKNENLEKGLAELWRGHKIDEW